MKLAVRRLILRTTAAALAGVVGCWSVPASAIACTAVVNPLAFGFYNGVTKAQVTTTTTFSLTCTGPGSLDYVVTLSPGQSATASARYMTNGRRRLIYQVYRDAALSQVLGDGSAGTFAIRGSATLPASESDITGYIYAVIPAGQAPVPGSYTDTLVLQLTY